MCVLSGQERDCPRTGGIERGETRLHVVESLGFSVGPQIHGATGPGHVRSPIEKVNSATTFYASQKQRR